MSYPRVCLRVLNPISLKSQEKVTNVGIKCSGDSRRKLGDASAKLVAEAGSDTGLEAGQGRELGQDHEAPLLGFQPHHLVTFDRQLVVPYPQALRHDVHPNLKVDPLPGGVKVYAKRALQKHGNQDYDLVH